MKRFLMLVGVAVVAAAMYVAASPASQQHSTGVSLKQFNALKKQVAALAKKQKVTNQHVNDLLVVYVHCSLHSELGIDRVGDPGGTFGYSYSPDGVNSSFTTGLDLATGSPPTFSVTPYNAADSGCQSLIGLALKHNPGSVLRRFALKH
jgi:hypothetical protein